MEKERADSWNKVETKDINAIARKTVDYSTFTKGTTISTRYHEGFISNLSREIVKGKQTKIIIIVNNIKFDAAIRQPNFKERDSIVIQITFKKKLIEYLSKQLSVSYSYIMKYKYENSKTQVKLPPEFKEYMDFYKGEEKDTFIVKLIKRAEEAINDVDDEDIDDNDIEYIEETSNETK